MVRRSYFILRILLLLVVGGLWATDVAHLQAGGGGGFRSRSVGGISIDAFGALSNPTGKDEALLLEFMRKNVGRAAADLNAPVGMRMISLRGLQDAIQEFHKSGFGELPEEIRFLAGLTRIQYVFLYPEENDIVIAGPGEGWRVDSDANVVGITTGRPVILLDDFLVALRTVRGANQGDGITCSIDPTAEGRKNLDTLLRKLKTFDRSIPTRIKRALGDQQITLTGIPENSHFARVLVAADYRMKRYGMDLEPAPIKGLPSFLDMLKAKGAKLDNLMPRWWLEMDYKPLARSEDGLAWQLRGQGVRCVSEDDFVDKEGAVKGTGGVNPIAKQWADQFTELYDELSAKEAIFGELRNIMDLCVVAALIEKENMLDRVGLSLPLLSDPKKGVPVEEWSVPKKVASQCSVLKVGRGYVIAASGGVQVESWQAAAKSEQNTQVAQIRTRAKTTGKKHWWWN